MKTLTLIAVAAILTGLTVRAEEDGKEYKRTYVIFIHGERVGKETVTESSAGNGDRIARTESEMYISDGLETNRMAFETRIVVEGKSLKPKSYMFRYVSGDSRDHYEVEVDGNTIVRTLSRSGATHVTTEDLREDAVIVDINVYHQYDYLIQKYDRKKGGRQVFSNFIPIVGNYIPVALTYLSESKLKYSKGEIPLQEYAVEFTGLQSGTLFADEKGRLVRLLMPDQALEVVREDVVPANR
jgi:hypothetical protein